jgi:hypothetical protein
LPFKTIVLYIYRSRGTMQYNQQLYVIYELRFFFLSSKSSATFDCAALGEIDLDSIGGSALGSPWILLIRRLSSLSRRHALADWKSPLADGEDSLSSANNAQYTSM